MQLVPLNLVAVIVVITCFLFFFVSYFLFFVVACFLFFVAAIAIATSGCPFSLSLQGSTCTVTHLHWAVYCLNFFAFIHCWQFRVFISMSEDDIRETTVTTHHRWPSLLSPL